MTLFNLPLLPQSPFFPGLPSSFFFSFLLFFCFGTLSLVSVDCTNTNELFTGTWAS